VDKLENIKQRNEDLKDALKGLDDALEALYDHGFIELKVDDMKALNKEREFEQSCDDQQT